MKKSKVAEIKKLDSGIYVRWEGTKKFVLVDDKTMALFIVYQATTDETQTSNYPLTY